METTLTEKALQALQRDSNLRAKIMLVPYKPNGKGASEFTIRRWVITKDDILTMPKYTKVISEHTGLSLEEILTKE